MQSSSRYLITLVVKILLWLPLCIAIWYWGWRPLTEPPAMLSTVILRASSVFQIQNVSLPERSLTYQLALPAQKISTPDGAQILPSAEVELEVAPLTYTFGLPFFFALMLASRSGKWKRKLLLGSFILLLLQAFSFSFDVLKQLMLEPSLAEYFYADWATATRTLIGFGYQTGTLIFPAVAPVTLWILFHRNLWLSLVAAGVLEDEAA